MPFVLNLPKLSPTMNEGTISKWHKKVGDFVDVGDVVFEVATDKATVEYNAVDDGYLRQILLEEGAEGVVNQPVAIFSAKKDDSIEAFIPKKVEAPKVVETAAAGEKSAAPVAATAMRAQATFSPEAPLDSYQFPESQEGRIKATPLARKLAREKGLDLSTAKGSGPQGRIQSADLATAHPAGLVQVGKREVPTTPPGTYTAKKMSPMRKAIAQRLQDSKSYIPHFYVSQTINAEPLMTVREQLKMFGVKVSVNDLITRACALALREMPEVNAGFDSATQSLISFKTIDVAIAVSLPEGLITPIVRHTDFKNVVDISLEVRDLAARAKAGKLQPHEYKGGSFTISNLGMFGISQFSAIINPPQAAILAVSGIEDAAVVRNGAIVAGKTMSYTLSYDHRVLDGAKGAEFAKCLQKYLENPAVLLV